MYIILLSYVVLYTYIQVKKNLYKVNKFLFKKSIINTEFYILVLYSVL